MHPRATISIWITILYGIYWRGEKRIGITVQSAVPALRKSYSAGKILRADEVSELSKLVKGLSRSILRIATYRPRHKCSYLNA